MTLAGGYGPQTVISNANLYANYNGSFSGFLQTL